MEPAPISITDPVPARKTALHCNTCGVHADRHCQQAGHDIEGLDRDAPTIRPEVVAAAELHAKLEAYVAKLHRSREPYPAGSPIALRYETIANELGHILSGTYDPRGQ